MEHATRTTLGTACHRILTRGDLEAKLDPLCWEHDAGPSESLRAPDAPARDATLALRSGSDRLPKLGTLRDPQARALCLARFAHHELMAVELFAWALLRWPTLPRELRREWARILGEEQDHCRAYLERLAAHGGTLGDLPCSDYLWRHSTAIAESPAGPRAFLCAMGLTYEQANLDFTLRYAEGFRAAGDAESANLLESVHADEIRHVASAARWLRALDEESEDDVARYEAAVPFPLSAARAKGRPFRAEARKRAGLEARFIEHVRRARSTQELAHS